jgi:CDP-diacylglycerol--glycerol-3-phosphate 3-phosphatidyltransferase
MILPNQLTVARIVLTPIFLYLFLSENPLFNLISVFVFVIAALTDWYDGWLARKYNYITNWGKFLDPLADKILTSAAFIGFVILNQIDLWMVILIIFRDFLVTGLRIWAEFNDLEFRTSYIAKVKTFLQMLFLYYLVLIFFLQNILSQNQIALDYLQIVGNKTVYFWILLGITILTLYTLIDYFTYNQKQIKEFLRK